ncbi:MAG: hypothetical protein K1Y02_24315 [Candidatus Hydrogenedentes bacterium]|nr:hypothetical protein [Candidatus Hydrogenedentota bacterium]
MNLVSVIDALDGNTLVVSPSWNVDGRTGNLVRVCGMNAPLRSTERGALAHCKMSLLLAGSYVKITRMYPPEGVVLPCEVEYRGLPLWMHFPEYSESGLWEVDTAEMPEITIDMN